jgi:hypothetical protein
VNKPRQFVALVVVCTCAVVAGCQARSTPEAVQTAIGVAQAAATALPDTQGLLPSLQLLLGGVSLDVKTAPDGAAKEWVTEVQIRGTDATGTLTQLDERARQTAVAAALAAAAQYYPNATISLTVVDGSGASVLTARKPQGKPPEFQ